MKFNRKSEFILMIIVVIAIIGSSIIQTKFYENFESTNIGLLPGSYPSSSEVPILVRDYPLKHPMKLNDHTNNLWKKYPVYGSSYEQKTNNVKYWKTPDNGMCSPLEFCGALYNNKHIIIPHPPPSIPLNANVIRVNYYASKK